MSFANEYRGHAAECVALAERLSDPADRARLIDMAQSFLDLADRQERQSLASRRGRSRLRAEASSDKAP